MHPTLQTLCVESPRQKQMISISLGDMQFRHHICTIMAGAPSASVIGSLCVTTIPTDVCCCSSCFSLALRVPDLHRAPGLLCCRCRPFNHSLNYCGAGFVSSQPTQCHICFCDLRMQPLHRPCLLAGQAAIFHSMSVSS